MSGWITIADVDDELNCFHEVDDGVMLCVLREGFGPDGVLVWVDNDSSLPCTADYDYGYRDGVLAGVSIPCNDQTPTLYSSNTEPSLSISP